MLVTQNPTPDMTGIEDQIRNWLLEQGLYQCSGTNLLKIAVDDALAFRDAFQDRYEAAVAGAQGNETLVHLISFADDVDVFAKLTSPHGRLRHHQRIGLRPDGQPNANVLAGKQAEIGVADGRARDDGAGRAIDRLVDESQLALVTCLRLARQE